MVGGLGPSPELDLFTSNQHESIVGEDARKSRVDIEVKPNEWCNALDTFESDHHGVHAIVVDHWFGYVHNIDIRFLQADGILGGTKKVKVLFNYSVVVDGGSDGGVHKTLVWIQTIGSGKDTVETILVGLSHREWFGGHHEW